MEFDSEQLIETLDSVARVQAARAELARALSALDVNLYGMWRTVKDPQTVAAHLPRSITSRTLRGAVLRLAPREDFVQPSLFETAPQAPGVELAA
ncbi:hypothetical protein LN042_22875 [Kitasatospora sp. RB6PN24]|uniref:hypothetical protein n=1 Tax=Kitasatospora humi TaxID=2893891 RepID=UPI001E585529|nr:hypothetical protein [Kitasatospora humi]MCC9309879.1 hypothetical protein [Kitasatospora humi]